MNPILVLPLTADDREQIIRHFSALRREDLRLRFGHALSMAALEVYVDEMDFDNDGIFGVVDSELRLVGVAHVARLRFAAEFGVSVLEDYRGHGIGQALFERAVTFARNLHIDVLFMHCLAENSAMLRIARRSGMEVMIDSGEADAYITLQPGNPETVAAAQFDDRIALMDFAFKSQVNAARQIVGAVADAATRMAESPDAESASNRPDESSDDPPAPSKTDA